MWASLSFGAFSAAANERHLRRHDRHELDIRVAPATPIPKSIRGISALGMQAVKLFYESPESKEGVAAFREKRTPRYIAHSLIVIRPEGGSKSGHLPIFFSAANAWFLGFLGYRPAHFFKLGRPKPSNGERLSPPVRKAGLNLSRVLRAPWI